MKMDFNIYIVDDASSDRTKSIGKSLAGKNPKIIYVRFERGPSRRENLALAFKKSKNEVIVLMDIDLSVNLRYLQKILEKIEKGSHISTGSRYMGINAKRTLSRKIISIVYNKFIRVYFGSKIKDHQCGFKAFRREVLLEVLKDMGYDKSMKRGWFWDAELLIRAQNKGYKVSEVPVHWSAGEQSSFNFKREMRMLNKLLNLKKELK